MQAVAGSAGQHFQARPDGGDGARLVLCLAGSLGHGGRQHDEAGAGLVGEKGDLIHRQVGRQMMNEPAVLTQADRRHEGGQAMPLTGRGGDDRDSPGPAARLLGMGGDQSLADRTGAVLLRDGNPAGRPVVPDPAQRGCDDVLTQVGQGHPARQPLQTVPGQGLLPVG